MWETFRDPETGRVYYANRETGESSWKPPPPHEPLIPYPEDDILRAWRAFRSPAHANELFFLNSLTKERVWDRPFKFYGMPEGEEEDHSKGPFIEYLDENGKVYWYNPRTKLVTRRRPGDVKTIVSEEAAYEELRSKGQLWEGRPSSQDIESLNDDKQDLVRPNRSSSSSSSDSSSEGAKHSSTSSSSSSSSSSSEESDSDEEEQKEDESKAPFMNMLKEKGVTKISKWPNWVAKIQNEPAFQHAPTEKVREWFEEFVKQLVQGDASSKAKIIAELKEEIEAWIKQDASGERVKLLGNVTMFSACSECPPMILEKFSSLGSMEKNAILMTLKKRF